MFVSSGPAVARTLVVGILSYAALIFFLRLSGNRTLSKMNAFDLVITVALGSTLASALTSQDVALMQAVVSFALLIGLQYLVARLSVASIRFRNLVRSEPVVLLRKGKICESALRTARLTRDELEQAARNAGLPGIETIDAILLETDGSLSVIQQAGRDLEVMHSVSGPHH